jgi:hypothetical protein
MTVRRNFKWIIFAALGSICSAAWVTVGVGLFIRFPLPIWTCVVTVAAVSTEVLFWALAAALGVSALQARHRLRAWIIKPFRRLS